VEVPGTEPLLPGVPPGKFLVQHLTLPFLFR
jgi:hypothetical protein